MRDIIAIAFFFLTSPALAAEMAPVLPSGWRALQEKDYVDRVTPYYVLDNGESVYLFDQDDPSYSTRLQLDLNGDGKADVAQMLRKEGEGEAAYGLFLFVSQPDGTYKTSYEGEVSMRSSGIKPEQPGQYVSPVDEHELHLGHAGIRYYYGQTKQSILYWDDKNNKVAWFSLTE